MTTPYTVNLKPSRVQGLQEELHGLRNCPRGVKGLGGSGLRVHRVSHLDFIGLRVYILKKNPKPRFIGFRV